MKRLHNVTFLSILFIATVVIFYASFDVVKAKNIKYENSIYAMRGMDVIGHFNNAVNGGRGYINNALNVYHNNSNDLTNRKNDKPSNTNNKANKDHGVGISAEFLRAVSEVNTNFVKGAHNRGKQIGKDIERISLFNTSKVDDVNDKTGVIDAGAMLRSVGGLHRRVEIFDEEKIDREQQAIKLRRDTLYKNTGFGLGDTANVLRRLDKNAVELKNKARNVVSENLGRVYKDVSKKVRNKKEDIYLLDKTTNENINSFKSSEREQKLKVIAEQLQRKGEQVADYVDIVVDNSAKGKVAPRAVNTVLRSSMGEVEALIKAETGIDVDLSSHSRRVVQEVRAETDKFEEQVKAFNERGGLDLYRDTDNDGISDYDEENIYLTDPNNAFTAGSSLTDGERILLGFDVHSTSTELVAVESPLVAGPVADSIFAVDDIHVKNNGAVTFKGAAMPNSFVTIYVYSTPIVVTVKADGTGKWEYVLDKQLEDGKHSLYVASVNNSGKILAKSTKVPFTKTAEAVDFTPLVPTVTEPTPIGIMQENALIAVIFVIAIFSIIVVFTLGSLKINKDKSVV